MMVRYSPHLRGQDKLHRKRRGHTLAALLPPNPGHFSTNLRSQLSLQFFQWEKRAQGGNSQPPNSALWLLCLNPYSDLMPTQGLLENYKVQTLGF